MDKNEHLVEFWWRVILMSIYVEKNRKTKALIQQFFLKVLEEKRFETITIGDIATIAKINRGTFYLHYKDKYDLQERMEEQLFTDLGNHIDELQSRYTSTLTFEKEQEQLAASLFHFIASNSTILKIFLSDHGRTGFHVRFRDAFSEKVRINLEKNEPFINNLKVPIMYFLSFITSAFLGLIEQWIENDLDKTPEEMTAIYIDIVSFIKRN